MYQVPVPDKETYSVTDTRLVLAYRWYCYEYLRLIRRWDTRIPILCGAVPNYAFLQVVPDIVTVGKPMGNGHPMGAVICSREISDRLNGYYSTFGGNPVSCTIGNQQVKTTIDFFKLLNV